MTDETTRPSCGGTITKKILILLAVLALAAFTVREVRTANERISELFEERNDG